MKEAKFTVRVVGSFDLKEGNINFKAANIVKAMEGCPMRDIVAALRSMDQTNSPASTPNPSRWITQFAGLESEAAGKAMEPWIQIVNDGQIVQDKRLFRELLNL
ncbi:MAG: hypothetical protein P8Y01_03400 [Woeseiaceae bacterium]|jgi:hypothetical protein